MSILAIITWVSGAIGAIACFAALPEGISAISALAALVGAAISGGVLYALGEMMDNIARIANDMRKFSIHEEAKDSSMR